MVDGKIAAITDGGGASAADMDRFQQQLWDPFGAWMDVQHHDDVPIMFADDTPTEQSIALWDQRLSEWVALRLAAEREATNFLEAFAAFDADTAGALLAEGATTDQIVTEDVQDYQQAIALYEAWGYKQQLEACRQVNATATALQVQCQFSYDLLGSDEMGLGPFDGSRFVVTVDSASGLITDVTNVWNGTDFSREVSDPFTSWMVSTYPDDLAVMSVEGGPSLTPESLALWAQHRQEYVQYVLDGTPSTTAA